METASEIQAEHVLLAASVILAAGSVLGFVARHLRVPDIVLFLIAGNPSCWACSTSRRPRPCSG
jgi:predicted Kef-type K+ transport protein